MKFFIYLLAIISFSCHPKNDKNSREIPQKKTEVKTKSQYSYPFYLDNINSQFTATAELENPDLYPKFYDLFAKYGYEGNGYCWEGHIIQILEKVKPNLLKEITFDPEAGSILIHFKSEQSQKEFAKVLCPIFSDLKKLEGFVKNADKTRIDN